jgi:hypothetical protein
MVKKTVKKAFNKSKGIVKNVRKTKYYRYIYFFIYTYLVVIDHIRLAFFEKKHDNPYFTITMLMCGFLFLSDIIGSMLMIKGYFGRFFFWSDTFSLVALYITYNST